MPMQHARASRWTQRRGLMKAIVDADTNEILGATVFGIEGGEIMAVFEVAMMGKLPYTALQNGIFAHPTLAEGLKTTLFSNCVENRRHRTIVSDYPPVTLHP